MDLFITLDEIKTKYSQYTKILILLSEIDKVKDNNKITRKTLIRDPFVEDTNIDKKAWYCKKMNISNDINTWGKKVNPNMQIPEFKYLCAKIICDILIYQKNHNLIDTENNLSKNMLEMMEKLITDNYKYGDIIEIISKYLYLFSINNDLAKYNLLRKNIKSHDYLSKHYPKCDRIYMIIDSLDTPYLLYPSTYLISIQKNIKFMTAPIINFTISGRDIMVHSMMVFPCLHINHDIGFHSEITHGYYQYMYIKDHKRQIAFFRKLWNNHNQIFNNRINIFELINIDDNTIMNYDVIDFNNYKSLSDNDYRKKILRAFIIHNIFHEIISAGSVYYDIETVKCFLHNLITEDKSIVKYFNSSNIVKLIIAAYPYMKWSLVYLKLKREIKTVQRVIGNYLYDFLKKGKYIPKIINLIVLILFCNKQAINKVVYTKFEYEFLEFEQFIKDNDTNIFLIDIINKIKNNTITNEINVMLYDVVKIFSKNIPGLLTTKIPKEPYKINNVPIIEINNTPSETEQNIDLFLTMNRDIKKHGTNKIKLNQYKLVKNKNKRGTKHKPKLDV